MTMKRITYLTAFLLIGTFARESMADGLYSNGHDLMVEAIRNGHASGVMTGDIDKRFSEQFKSNGPLLVEAKRIIAYKQAGCARVSVNYTKKEVPIPQGTTAVHLDTQINYCVDGSAPKSLEQAP